MKYEDFNASVRQKLDDLADTETNRKRHETDAEINAISQKIQEQTTVLDNYIAEGKYDNAVTVKAEISRLASKQEILMDVAKKLDAIPEYDDKDLRKLSDEVVNYYNSVLKGLYKDRIKILEQLDKNYERMKESKSFYNDIKKLIDSNASDFNYAANRTYGILSNDSQWLKDIDMIQKLIKSIEEDFARRGWNEE